MAEIINLRMARKAKAKAQSTQKAEANRALHGQTKAQKRATADEQARIASNVDGAKLDKD
jgi:hypothetical protein